ncbi:hypothetical protein ACFYMW_34580 [Streptomyces sp. NPDC006692]|uniref:hypothetical protein n=1 Tax=Streptomyces sp. NPDC006692 TaxID=3364758 RepID=UPI0036744B4E
MKGSPAWPPTAAKTGDALLQPRHRPDGDGLTIGAAPHPRPGEADLIGCPVTRPLPRTQPPEQIAGHERGVRGDDDARHDHRTPIEESCSMLSGVSVAALLR